MVTIVTMNNAKARSLLFQAFLLTFLINLVAFGQQQPTVGVLYQSPGSYDGFTLMPVTSAKETYLINNCGEMVNSWTSAYTPGMMAYLTPDGELVRAGRVNNPNFGAGGTGGIIEKFDWEGNLTWSYMISSDTVCQHHDIAVMPNGNVLALAWRAYPGDAWIERGRDPQQTSAVVWGTYILEIEPDGATGGNVVWTWEAFNHLIQDFDPDKPNFGDPALHPSQLNVNYQSGANDKDWLHANSIAYNEELDQIMVSIRDFSELWVINHGVPNEETSGPAGHLMYRWGNAEAYGRGTAEDRVFFKQHDARWIDDGRIMVYSNGNERPEGLYSTIEIINPHQIADGSYPLEGNLPWGPAEPEWTYPSEFDPTFFSPNTSGAQQLPNGNVLITEGAYGQLREVTPDEEIVWEYTNPMGVFGATAQYSNPVSNGVFRAMRYLSTFPGFEGRDMTGNGVLEIYADTGLGSEMPTCALYPLTTCATDLNDDLSISTSDLLSFLGAFGCSNQSCDGDFNGDGLVGVSDLLILLTDMGSFCAP